MWFALFYFVTTSHVSLLLDGEVARNFTQHSFLSIVAKGRFIMFKRIIARCPVFKIQHYICVTVIALALLLHLPVSSWAASGVIDLPRTGQTKCYDTSGTEIFCTGTGQDGDIQAGVAWPSPRFVDNGDGTVADKLTGLMWTRDETKQMTWQEALDYVKTLNTGSHTDWRLPNVNELRSLVDYSQYDPSLPQGHSFTNAKASDYWSSTTNAGVSFAYYAWIVNFQYGYIDGGGYSSFGKTDGGYVRAVRGGSCPVICLPKTGQTKCYDTSGTEISCAGTGQDGDIQAGVAWPSPRFVDNGDETVTDKLTGLMWIKGATGQMTWQSAIDYVKILNIGGHTDWRLPNVEELRSLVDYSQTEPSLPQGHPFMGAVASYYWSSTTYASDAAGVWGVSFLGGSVLATGKSNAYCVRAVRGGQSGSLGTPCPAKTALGKQAQELQPLRVFRDGVMKKSDQGKGYAELYYRLALEISSLLEAHPQLKEETQRLIVQLLPMVQTLLVRKDVRIDAETITQAIALLDSLSALGSPSLKADLFLLKKKLQSGRLFEELHISVAGREK
jgi:hypothetical protein